MESGRFVLVKQSFIRTDSVAKDPSLIDILSFSPLDRNDNWLSVQINDRHQIQQIGLLYVRV